MLQAFGHGIRVVTVHTLIVAYVLIPTAARDFEDARIVEGCLLGLEVGILPDLAELIAPGGA